MAIALTNKKERDWILSPPLTSQMIWSLWNQPEPFHDLDIMYAEHWHSYQHTLSDQ